MKEIKPFAIICRKELNFGFSVYATLKSNVLGGWDTGKTKELKYLENDIWYLVIEIEDSSDLEYKLYISDMISPNIDNIDPFLTEKVILTPKKILKQLSEISFLSFNIRFANPNDGINVWGIRSKHVSGLIQNYDDDIIGVQEALLTQIDDIQKDLGNSYEIYAVGRGGEGKNNESCAILCKRERFLILNKGTFWLSETPDIIGSKLEGSTLPRICSWMRLFDFYNERIMFVFNTHLDHMSPKIRYRMVGILFTYMEKLLINSISRNVILMGDFNAFSDEETISFIKKKFNDSCLDEKEFTFHGWTGKNQYGRIDYIFYKENRMGLKDFKTIKDQYEENGIKKYPSDHFPIRAIFSFGKIGNS